MHELFEFHLRFFYVYKDVIKIYIYTLKNIFNIQQSISQVTSKKYYWSLNLVTQGAS